ncbi:DUF397 domain-containing protein [Actinoplanes utahensis]|nr:DUF397 domain-containing protein [Actinoplanes utahensis]GIF28145.1 hypothetical protein Aut01nite_11310 [Actinoplanes utahensis]
MGEGRNAPWTLRQVVESPGYPLPAGTAPDRFLRQLADLIPDWRVPEFESDAGDIFLVAMAPGGSRPSISITVGFPGESGYRAVDEWRVTCEGDVIVELPLTHDAGLLEFAAVIRVARAMEVLPRSPIPGKAPIPGKDSSVTVDPVEADRWEARFRRWVIGNVPPSYSGQLGLALIRSAVVDTEMTDDQKLVRIRAILGGLERVLGVDFYPPHADMRLMEQATGRDSARPGEEKEHGMIVESKGMTLDLNGAKWQKSSRSGAAGHCVEAANAGEGIAVRDSKNPAGGVLIFTSAEWDAFLAGAKDGEFDRQG